MKFNANQFKKQLYNGAEKQLVQKIRNAITNTYPEIDMGTIEVTVDLLSPSDDGRIKIIGINDDQAKEVLKNF